jgi:hypothetical protein
MTPLNQNHAAPGKRTRRGSTGAGRAGRSRPASCGIPQMNRDDNAVGHHSSTSQEGGHIS